MADCYQSTGTVPFSVTELGLDMAMMTSTAKLEFTFEEVDGKRRIAAIKNSISMANLEVKPNLTFAFTEVEGVTLVWSPVWVDPAGDEEPGSYDLAD